MSGNFKNSKSLPKCYINKSGKMTVFSFRFLEEVSLDFTVWSLIISDHTVKSKETFLDRFNQNFLRPIFCGGSSPVHVII